MRSIKFRAWIGHDGHYMDYFELRKDECGDWSNWLEDTPIMQFTGLLDLNGKEIYEGDVVKLHDGRRSTVFFEPNGGVGSLFTIKPMHHLNLKWLGIFMKMFNQQYIKNDDHNELIPGPKWVLVLLAIIYFVFLLLVIHASI